MVFIKEIMLKEKIWNEETRKLLIDQINYLKSEITIKNTLIGQIITELSYRKRNLSSYNNGLNDHENSSMMNLSIPNENDETSLSKVLIICRNVQRKRIRRSISP